MLQVPVDFLIFLTWVGLLVWAAGLPAPWSGQLVKGLYLLPSVWLWGKLLSVPQRKSQAGSLLLKVGRITRYPSLSICALILGLTVLGPSSRVAHAGIESPFEGLKLLLFLSLAVYLFLSWLRGWEIREHGILSPDNLIRWHEIESYDWEEATILRVQLKRGFFREWIWLPVPPDKKQVLHPLLAQHLSDGTAA